MEEQIINVEPANIINFCADEIAISDEKLCLKFNEIFLNLESIKTLEFDIKGKKYTYTKK